MGNGFCESSGTNLLNDAIVGVLCRERGIRTYLTRNQACQQDQYNFAYKGLRLCRFDGFLYRIIAPPFPLYKV